MSLADKLKRNIRNTILGIGLVGVLASCDNVNPPNGNLVACNFNPAIEYANQNNILGDYDVTGLGTYCFWNPKTDTDKDPVDFLDPHEHNRTRMMLDWMHELDQDEFYTHDQVQSLVSRFGEGIINPETGEKVSHDTGRINVDEYMAAREFYEKAKEMNEWAIANQHRSPSIKPEHYQNFNAWSIRLFGWPYPQPEFDMPQNTSLLNITGLEPGLALGGYTPANWGLDNYGTPGYSPMNFIGLESLLTGKEEWMVCKTNVEDVLQSSQIFPIDPYYVLVTGNTNVLVQSMLYSPGTIVIKRVSTPGPPVEWHDMTMQVEHPVSATLIDLGGYENGHKLTITYAHISGEDGNMEDSRVPNEGTIIPPREVFAWLNTQRPQLLGDFQGYVPTEARIPGPQRPTEPHRTQVDMYIESLPPGQKAGWNDPRANRHDNPTNYAIAIGIRSVFAPCVRAPGYEGEWIHEPR